MTSTALVSSATAVKVAQAAFAKVYDPNQPRDDHGRWSETGQVGAKFPLGLSSKQIYVRDELRRAMNYMDNLEQNQTDTSHPDYIQAKALVDSLEHQKRALHDNRVSILRGQERGQPTVNNESSVRYTTTSSLNNSIAEANARRASEAQRIQSATEALHRQYRNAGLGDAILSNAPRPQGAGLHQAIYDASNRVVAASGRIASIAANVRGITSTTNYSAIGTHIFNIQNDINSLRMHIRELPAESRTLYNEALASLERTKKQLGRLKSAIGRKFSRK